MRQKQQWKCAQSDNMKQETERQRIKSTIIPFHVHMVLSSDSDVLKVFLCRRFLCFNPAACERWSTFIFYYSEVSLCLLQWSRNVLSAELSQQSPCGSTESVQTEPPCPQVHWRERPKTELKLPQVKQAWTCTSDVICIPVGSRQETQQLTNRASKQVLKCSETFALSANVSWGRKCTWHAWTDTRHVPENRHVKEFFLLQSEGLRTEGVGYHCKAIRGNLWYWAK